MSNSKKTVTWKIGRDAEDGRFKPVQAAHKDKSGSIVETMRRPVSPQPKRK
ncbi:MAG: hypothetical protein ABL891_04515 [Burkholderiales bacterium]